MADDLGLGLLHDDIEPVLKNHCHQYPSHDFGEVEGDLVLDSQSSAIGSGEPERSLLIKAVEYHDEHLQMPPSAKLSGEVEIWWVRR